eukprot:4064608-Amphidinium_carterae.1
MGHVCDARDALLGCLPMRSRKQARASCLMTRVVSPHGVTPSSRHLVQAAYLHGSHEAYEDDTVDLICMSDGLAPLGIA